MGGAHATKGFRRRSFVATLCTLAALVRVAAAEPPDRAVWVWEKTTFRILDDAEERTRVFDFLAKKRIRTIYLYADSWNGRNSIRDEPTKYRTLIDEAHRRAHRVFALLGSSYLKTQEYVLPEKREEARAMFRRVLEYQRTAGATERFDGMSLDIEPHLLPDWGERRPALGLLFVELLADLSSLRNDGLPPLDLGAAIPFWFDGVGPLPWRGTTRPLSEHVQDVLDHVVLMDYRDRAEGSDGIIRHARREIAYADRIGKTVIVGVEVAPGDPPKITFHDEDEARLERELERTAEAFAGNPSFGGFAVHHFDAWRRWAGRDP